METKQISHSTDGRALANPDVDADRKKAIAFSAISPLFRNADLAGQLAAQSSGIDGRQALVEATSLVRSSAKRANAGDMSDFVGTLAVQMSTLDALFVELARRACINMHRPKAAEIYARLALKAQSGCVATAEAVAKINRRGEQIVKHVYVDNRGGQAVVTDTLVSRTGKAESDKRPQAPGGPAEASYALSGQNPESDGLSVASDAKRQVPDARRKVTRTANR